MQGRSGPKRLWIQWLTAEAEAGRLAPGNAWYNHDSKLITGTKNETWSAASGYEDDKYDRQRFIYAYARDSKDNAFAVDRLGWQLAWAYKVDEVLQRQIHSSTFLRSDSKSVYELSHLELHVTGIHHADRKLRFQWIEVLCSVDIDLVAAFLEEQAELFETVYRRRWADDRYVFATPENCPIPKTLEDLCQIGQFEMGLVLEVLLWRSISRWSMQNARRCSFWDLNHFTYLSEAAPLRIVAAIQLKPALKQNAVDGPYTDQIQALVNETIKQCGRSYFIYAPLPSTIIQKMDQLVEEMSNETQCQRQQGQICESEGSLHEPEASAD